MSPLFRSPQSQRRQHSVQYATDVNDGYTSATAALSNACGYYSTGEIGATRESARNAFVICI